MLQMANSHGSTTKDYQSAKRCDRVVEAIMIRKEHTSMPSKTVFLRLFVCLFICAVSAAQNIEVDYYGGGTGEPNDPYQIWTPKQFVAINAHSEDWGSHFRLMADVNLAHTDPELIAPIGNYTVPFSGVFDGNHFAIENFVLDDDTSLDVGVFGVVSTVEMHARIHPDEWREADVFVFDYRAYDIDPNESVVHIKNLKLVDVNVSGAKFVGGLAGRCYGSIKDCQLKGGRVLVYPEQFQGYYSSNRPWEELYDQQLLGRRSYGIHTGVVGGVTGLLLVGKLVACDVSSVQIEGDTWAGGVVGYSDESMIERCSVTGQLVSRSMAGGIVGEMVFTQMHQSGADVHVVGGHYLGGLAGIALGSRISQCSARGRTVGEKAFRGITISLGEKDLGGLIGYSFGSLLSDCYAQCDVNSVWFREVGGLIGRSQYDTILQCYCAGRMTSENNSLFEPSIASYVRERSFDDLDERLTRPPFGPSGGSFIGGRSFDDFDSQLTRSSFWDQDVSTLDVGVSYEMNYSDNNYPIEEITSLPTPAMMSQETFTNVGWDFESVWAIDEGVDYPVLQWELAVSGIEE